MIWRGLVKIPSSVIFSSHYFLLPQFLVFVPIFLSISISVIHFYPSVPCSDSSLSLSIYVCYFPPHLVSLISVSLSRFISTSYSSRLPLFSSYLLFSLFPFCGLFLVFSQFLVSMYTWCPLSCSYSSLLSLFLYFFLVFSWMVVSVFILYSLSPYSSFLLFSGIRILLIPPFDIFFSHFSLPPPLFLNDLLISLSLFSTFLTFVVSLSLGLPVS